MPLKNNRKKSMYSIKQQQEAYYTKLQEIVETQKNIHVFLIDLLYETKGKIVFHEVPKFSTEFIYIESLSKGKENSKIYSVFGLSTEFEQPTLTPKRLFYSSVKFDSLKSLISTNKVANALLFSVNIAEVLKGHNPLEIVVIYRTEVHEDVYSQIG